MKAVINELLHKYMQVESKFQQGPYDKCVKSLRDEYKDDVEMVVWNIFSHAQVAKKNILTIKLIVSLISELLLSGYFLFRIKTINSSEFCFCSETYSFGWIWCILFSLTALTG